MRVLCIEDYGPLRRSIRKGLTEAGFVVDVAEDGEEGLEFAESSEYEVIVLDLMLPKIDGSAVLDRLRRRGNSAAVLILTAKGAVEDRVHGLDRGADDYLAKPFAFEELVARVRALVRRRHDTRSTCIRLADLEIDTSARTVSLRGRPVDLTAREYAILEFLAFRRGKIVTRSEIWERVADFADEATSNVIDVYVGRLRRKLEMDEGPRLIHTKRGLGYTFGIME